MEKEAIQNKEKNFVSCVLYLHNDGKNIREFLKTVCGTMEQNFEKYEIVCVNDCCMDDTIEEIHRYLEESNTRHVVSLINLSFYQGVEMAMNAGRDLAVGDFLFEFDRCLLDFEPSLIMDIYHKALEGYDVVAAAPKRDVAFTSRLFYAVYNLGSRNTHKLRQERFRIISRRAVNRVNQMNAYIPSCTSRFSSLANSESISLYPIPNTALCTVPYSFKSAITLLTMEVGIANE